MSNPDPNWRKYERRLYIAVFANFLLFGAITVFIGGDAINGRIEDGLHILSAHGQDTVVSPGLWHYSLFHARLTIISFLLVFGYTVIRNLFFGRANLNDQPR